MYVMSSGRPKPGLKKLIIFRAGKLLYLLDIISKPVGSMYQCRGIRPNKVSETKSNVFCISADAPSDVDLLRHWMHQALLT